MNYFKDKFCQKKNFQRKNQKRRNNKDLDASILQQKSIGSVQMNLIQEEREEAPYAGPKFISSPSASSLPKPPSHWITSCHVQDVCCCDTAILTEQLRQILKITPVSK